MKKKWVEYAICRVTEDPKEAPESWAIFTNLRDARRLYNKNYRNPASSPLNKEFVLVRETYEVLNEPNKRPKQR